MRQVNIHEAKTRFSELVAAVEAGEEIVVARAGKPVLRLVREARPLPKGTVYREPGALRTDWGEWDQAAWDAADAEILQDFEDSINRPFPKSS